MAVERKLRVVIPGRRTQQYQDIGLTIQRSGGQPKFSGERRVTYTIVSFDCHNVDSRRFFAAVRKADKRQRLANLYGIGNAFINVALPKSLGRRK